VALGSLVEGGNVKGSVLGQWTTIEADATVTDSVLFEHVEVGEGATVHRAILDKWVTVVPGATVGIDKQQDLSRGFTVTESGITVVAKGLVVA
jgi:glucose-1-phosphate adenylyltransferase